MGMGGSGLFGGGDRTLRPVSVERSAPVEYRLEGRTLHGVAMRYGEQARDRPEMFEAGAFAPIGPVAMNLQHDRSGLREIASTDGGSLRIEDTPAELRIEADLRRESAELSLVRRRALRGLSVEFRTRAETRNPAGVRVIGRAELVGIGLVDSGSYRSNIEVRAAMADAWLTGSIRFGKRMRCECQGPCTDVQFEVGAFQDLVDRRDVLAVGGGGFANVLGSTRRGTLLVDQTDKGLQVGLTNSGTATARRVVEAAAVADIFVRPLIDLEQSEYRDEGTTRIFSLAVTRALLVKPTVNSEGHTAAKIKGVPEHRRRRRWL